MNIARTCRSLGLSVAIMCCVFGGIATVRYITLHANPIYSVIFILTLLAVCIAIPIYQWLSEQEKP